MDLDCPFCRIGTGDGSAFVVAEDASTIAFLDRAPATPGHTLVVPRSHADDIWAIADDDYAAVMRLAKRVAQLLDERLAPDGLYLTQSNRAAGWQDVFHFHVHLIPRWSGDGLTPPWSAAGRSSEELASVWRRLR